jgi:hypothetical protein
MELEPAHTKAMRSTTLRRDHQRSNTDHIETTSTSIFVDTSTFFSTHEIFVSGLGKPRLFIAIDRSFTNKKMRGKPIGKGQTDGHGGQIDAEIFRSHGGQTQGDLSVWTSSASKIFSLLREFEDGGKLKQH